MGHIIFFSLEVFNQCTEHIHSNGIKEIYLDTNGTQLCFIDNKFDAYMYNPVQETVLQIPDCLGCIEGVIWDQNILERNIFTVYNKTLITTYIFVKYFIEGKLKFENYTIYIKQIYYVYFGNRYKNYKDKYNKTAI